MGALPTPSAACADPPCRQHPYEPDPEHTPLPGSGILLWSEPAHQSTNIYLETSQAHALSSCNKVLISLSLLKIILRCLHPLQILELAGFVPPRRYMRTQHD